MTDVLVVGGGITGLCIAAECARSGRSVEVLEQRAFGDGHPPLAILAAPLDDAHVHVWRQVSGAFLLDRDPLPVLADGEEVGRAHRVDPAGLVGAWVAECVGLGVVVHAGTGAHAVVRFGGSVTGVHADRGTLPARTVVFAAGARTPRFLHGTAGDIPIARVRRAYRLLGPSAPAPSTIVEIAGRLRIVADPLGRVFAEALVPGDVPWELLPDDLAALPELDSGELIETRTATGEPLVGQPAWVDGVIVAYAGTGRALDAAPGIARVVVDRLPA